MKKSIVLFNILLLGLYSCKKDSTIHPIVPPETPPVNVGTISNIYFPMSIGSFWVYEFDTHQPNGAIIDNNTIDTVKIIGDTLMNEDTYFVFKSNVPTPNAIYYRRINEGEVVSQSGRLICPANNYYSGLYNSHYGFSDRDTAYHYWEEFSVFEGVNTVFGDTFNGIQMTANHNTWPAFGAILTADTNYFSSIGMLQRSYGYLSGIKLIGTLVDYHIE